MVNWLDRIVQYPNRFTLVDNGATTTAGTGQLFASSGANITKDNTQSLTISVEIEVKEAV